MFAMADPNSYDENALRRGLDKCKANVFMAPDAVFFGSIMCSLTFSWTRSVKTAATDGTNLYWNPDFFMAMTHEARNTVLKHELWHVARLHSVRCGTRDPKTWNWACDIRINNDLENSKNSFEGIEQCWKDQNYDKMGAGLMSEEDIYDILIANQMPPPKGGSWGGGASKGDPDDGDLLPSDNQKDQQIINTVVQAVQQAKLAGQAGKIPGGIETLLKHFLEPQVPWETLLMKFFTDLLDEDYSWKRPNRRFEHIYLPSRFTDDGRLEHLEYFLDVSGSISDHDILRFNSEVKFIQEVLQPQRLTLIQFDTEIQQIDEFEIGQPFNEIKVTGRGGTCLIPVRDYIEKTKPTAAVVFSDLYVEPMEPLTVPVDIIWCVYHHPSAQVPFGTKINIK